VKLVSNRTNIVLMIAVVLLVVLPLAFVKGSFGGSDDQGSAAIAASVPGFKPWAHPIWTPPSPEIESLLFALQAAIGAGVIGYVLGRAHGAARGREAKDAADATSAPKQKTSTSPAAR
jgi:cobalt/nickel transport protein